MKRPTETQMEDGHVVTQAKISYTNINQGMPTASGKHQKLAERAWPADILILYFQPPELRES